MIKLLNELTRIPLTINWDKIVGYQTKCLKNGVNKVGIPDLIILDNVLQNDLELYTLDKHFNLMQKIVSFKLVPTFL